ncbi:InlB B-repeat-containing protein [[Clostridium] innocuum]|uniref:InlB B-repeat-containing protein n=1 Tax=Clostridium innocuum TaxID=1522 RepID=UPI0023431ED0|nr:InlB B-repeat-containing protein [[Clostridium] innocuum]
MKDSKVLTFPGIIDPAKTEVTAKEGYAVEQVTLNGEAFKNNIVYNREAGESEKNLVINVYTKAALTIHYQDANGNKITADDMKEGKLNEKLAFTGKAIDGYTASKDNASEAVLDKASNEVTLVYEKNKAVNKAQISKKADAKASKPVTCSAASSKNCFKADGTYVAENGILYPTEYTAQTGSGKVYHDTNQVGENGKPCANGQVGNLGSDVLPYRHYVVLKYSTDIKVVTYIRCDVYQGMMNPPTPDKDTYKVDFLTSEDLSKLGSIYVNEGEKINEKDVPEAAAKSFYDKRNEDYFWTREQNSNTKVDPATIIINSPTTIYSKGKNKEAVKFTVTFDLAGGVYNNQTENSIVQVENGKKISESAIPVPTLGGKDFKGWNLEGYGNKLYSNKDIAEMNINKNLKFEAVYEKKAYTNEAEYFILLPSSKLPDNLSANYDPNNFVPSNINSWNGPGWNGSNISHDQGTGFSGYISKDAYQKAYVEGKPITNEKGVDSNYIYIPSGNIPAEYTVNNGVDKGKVMKLENIVWYSIKKQDNGKPHVDGYIKAVEVEIGYYANIDGLDSSSIEHAVTGNEYTVKDYSSIRDFPNRTGYIFTGWNTKADGSGTSYAAGERFTVKNSVALYAQWKKTDQKYTIEHIDEDTNTKLKPDETFDAKYGDVINGENHKQTIEGYAFTKADSLKVGTDKEKNIIKIYYSKDANGDNVPDKYQIKVIYKAVNGTIDADHANEPENKTFYVNLYKDGKFATAEDGGVGSLKKDQIGTATAAKGYAQDSLQWTPTAPTTDLELNKDTEFVAAFEKDSFGYSIEYYYDDVKADTVKKSDKFEEVITLKPEESVSYNNKSYVLDNVENNPLTISTDEKTNVIRVYYATDENEDKIPDKYQIKVIYKAVNGTIDADHANEPENKTFYVNLYKDGKFATAEDGGAGSLKKDQIGTATAAKGYAQDSLQWTPTAPTTDLELNKDTEFVAAFEKDSFGYSIEYYYDDVKADTVKKSDKFEEVITLKPEESVSYNNKSYVLDNVENNPLTISTDEKTNVIRVYYATDENEDKIPDKYQIKVIYKAVNGTIDADHANEAENKTFYVNLYKDGKFATAEDGGVGSLKKDQIGTATAAKGYAQDSLKWTPAAPTTDLKLSKDTEFVAAFEKDSFGYSIEYYYDNIKADTVKKSDKFENVISINPDKSIEYKGNTYALDKTQNNPLTISSDVEKNVIKVFYAEDKNGNGEPDYKEEKYNVNFVAEANGTLAGTTLYNSVLADTKISEIKDYVMPIPQANANYAFDKWIVKDVKHPEGIEIKDPGSYVVTGNTVFYAYFAEDNHGTDPENPDTPDNIPDKYQTEVTFRAVNGSVSFEKTYVTLYDEKGEYSENGTGRLAANQIPATTANNGYHFVNWTPDTPNEDMIISREGAAFTANHAINTYSAVVRFINEDTDEELAPSATLNDIEHGSILYGTEHRIDITGYVFTIADTEIIERNGVVVNVYYAADTKGGVDDPDTTPDGIPDKYQVRFEYTAGTNGSVSGTTIEYVTRPGNSTTASVRPQALVATAANTGYSFVSWTANGNVYSNTDALRNTYFAEDTVFTAGFAVIAAPVLPTPVTPIPPAVTPQTPVPAAPAAPGTTPAATPVIVPVLPTPTPTPTPGPTVDVENPDQPQGGETTDVPDNPTPKAGSEDSWALINLLCAGGTVLLGLILLLSKLKKEEDEEDDKTSAMANKDDEQSERYKRRKWLRLASTITAIVSVIAFFLTEDITLPMILMDKWTLLMAAFLIVQIIFVLFGRKWKELDENDNSTETAHS